MLLIGSCTSETSSPGAIATNAHVISATLSSMTISWSRDPNDDLPDTVFVMTSSGAQAGNSPILINYSGAVAIDSGLTPDVPYTIFVGSMAGRTSSISYTIFTRPSGIMVNSVDAASIGVEWTRDPNDTEADTIVATTLDGTIAGYLNPTTASNGIVTGLNEGVPYNISIHIGSGASDSMIWMTAERTSGINIFEMADTNSSDPNVLILADTANGGVQAIPFKGAPNGDFVLNDIASLASGISLESGAVLNGEWNLTNVSDSTIFVPGGLNNYYRSTDYTAAIAAANGTDSYDIPDDAAYNTKGSRILICETQSGNLALVEIVPNATTGQLFSTNVKGYKYITVNVSYQSAIGAFYARRGRPRRGSGTVPRIPSQ